jgi:hypothetical protein
MKSGLEWSERLVRAAGFDKPSSQSRTDVSTRRRPRHAGTACKVPNASGMLSLWLLGGHVPILRADFDVKASLVLPDNSPPLTLRHGDGQYEIVLRNGPKGSDGHAPRLDVSVMGPCEDFDGAAFHGRSARSIEKDLDRTQDDLVNESASVAWHAIQSKIPAVEREKLLTFGHRGGNFITNDIIVGPQLLIENDGQSEHLADDALFDVGITLQTRYGPPSPDANTE